MAAASLLIGLALEPMVQQFALKQLGLKQDTTSEEKLPSIVLPDVEKTPNELLVQEGKRLGVLSLNGQQHPTLQRAAEEHADFQARHGVQGHQMWQSRMSQLQRQLPGLRFVECANESWPSQNARDAAIEMYHSWVQSPGHWAAVNGECKYWGMAMVLSYNGTWYACEIVAK